MELKHSDIVTRITMLLLVAAVVGFLVLFAYEGAHPAGGTAVAVSWTQRETVELTGLIVRQETVLTSHSLHTSVTVPDALRVSAGDVLGLSYSSAEDLRRAGRMSDLTGRISLAESVLQDTESTLPSVRSALAAEAVRELTEDVARHDTSSLREDALAVRSLLFNDGAQVTREELSRLRQELREMQEGGEVASEELVSPASGLFTSVLDGDENLDPAVLTNLTAPGLRKLMKLHAGVDGRAYGKLVTDSVWYLAALLPEEDAAEFRAGDGLSLDLSRYRAGLCPVTVLSVSAPSEGERAVLLRCEEYLAGTLMLRDIECPLVLSGISGLRLPRAAVQTGEGAAYVTVDTGAAERRCAVEILWEDEEYVLVRGEGLAAGSAVLLR